MKPLVLIIEDDQDIREVLAMYLDRKGYRVIAATSLETADMSTLPNIILMDLTLSGKSGLDICRALKNSCSTAHIPVLMMSAGVAAKEKCLQSGADGFIPKPFAMKDMEAFMSRLLSH